MAERKVGEDFARDMFHRGLAEIQAASFWGGSNVSQPNHAHAPVREPEPSGPEPEVNREAEQERDR